MRLILPEWLHLSCVLRRELKSVGMEGAKVDLKITCWKAYGLGVQRMDFEESLAFTMQNKKEKKCVD